MRPVYPQAKWWKSICCSIMIAMAVFPGRHFRRSGSLPLSNRSNRFSFPTKRAIATADEGSMMILVRSQTNFIESIIPRSLTVTICSTRSRTMGNVNVPNEESKPSAIVLWLQRWKDLPFLQRTIGIICQFGLARDHADSRLDLRCRDGGPAQEARRRQ